MISEKIKYIRNDLNLNQKDFANLLNVAQSTVSRIEKGERQPEYEFLRNFIIKFNINPDWIFFDKERNKYWIQTYFDLVSGASFLLFPVVLLIIYFNLGIQTSKTLIIFLLVFAKILLFYKSIRNFFKHVYGFLHFILYFCALEIIPLILFWKGITYINNILVLKF